MQLASSYKATPSRHALHNRGEVTQTSIAAGVVLHLVVYHVLRQLGVAAAMSQNVPEAPKCFEPKCSPSTVSGAYQVQLASSYKVTPSFTYSTVERGCSTSIAAGLACTSRCTTY